MRGLELCRSWSTGTKFERCHVILSKMEVLAAVGSAAARIATPALASKAHKRKAAAHDEYTTQTQRAHDGKAIYSWDGRYRLGTRPEHSLSDHAPKLTAGLKRAIITKRRPVVAYEISFGIASSHRERNSGRSAKRHHASEFGRHLRLWHRIKPGQPACSFFYKPQGTVRKRRCQLYQNKTRPLP